MNLGCFHMLDYYSYFNFEEKLHETLIVIFWVATAHLRLLVKSAVQNRTKIAATVSSCFVIAEALKAHHLVLHIYSIYTIYVTEDINAQRHISGGMFI